MNHYSDLVDAVVRDEDLLRKLRPTESSSVARLLKIRAASDDELAGGNAIINPSLFALVRAGLVYACDSLEESHMIVQGIGGDESAYWHGMIHRRQADFENARYWYRRAGVLPFFAELHGTASPVSPVVASQPNWDPYLFTGLCEQEKFGQEEQRAQLVKLQGIEFRVALDYAWRKSVKPQAKTK